MAYYCKMTSILLRKDMVMAQKDGDLKKIKDLIKILEDNDLVEVEIKHGDDKILLKRSQAQQPTITAVPMIGSNIAVAPAGTAGMEQASSGDESLTSEQQGLVEIKSPIVGTFYSAPSPDSEPYVEVESQVDLQTVVCLIESMKVMNEIKAEVSGKIVEIKVTNGQAVEYGQVLFRVKPE